MSFGFHHALERQCELAENEIKEELAIGTPSDWGEYQYRRGIVEGIRRALRESAALAKKISES